MGAFCVLFFSLDVTRFVSYTVRWVFNFDVFFLFSSECSNICVVLGESVICGVRGIALV